MNFVTYFILSLIALSIDNLMPYIDCSIYSILIFINLIGLYLIILQVEVDIEIRYGNQIERD